MTSIDWKTAVRNASRTLNLVGEEKKNELLLALADATEKHIDEILKANAEDLSKMDKSDSMYDRLLLTEDRLKGIAADIRKVAQLPSPLNKVLEQRTLPNGLELKKVSVPFGVIGIIYEARPNVSFDVFSLCFKSGNACVLKGGTNAHASNSAIVALIQNVLKENGIDENVVHLMPAGRESTAELLNAVGSVDMIIPRGSAGLINFVRENSRVPVIETGAGVVSTYFDAQGDVEKGKKIINNGTVQRILG